MADLEFESKHPRKAGGKFRAKAALPHGDRLDLSGYFEKMAAELREEAEAQGFSIEQRGDSIEVGYGYYTGSQEEGSVYRYDSRCISLRDDSTPSDHGAALFNWDWRSYEDGELESWSADDPSDMGGMDGGTDENILDDLRDSMEHMKDWLETALKEGEAFLEDPYDPDLADAERERWEAEYEAERTQALWDSLPEAERERIADDLEEDGWPEEVPFTTPAKAYRYGNGHGED